MSAAMSLNRVPLNALRAFEVSARQLSFTRAGLELRVTQAAVSQQVKTLEEILGVPLFRRLPRLAEFRAAQPFIDVRLMTNNNRVDLAGEGLDYAIRFGDGAWHGTEALRLFSAPLSPLCAPPLARRLRQPADLARETLLRSYRVDEWSRWFATVDLPARTTRGFVFDSSLTMAEAAVQGTGVALLPVRMFEHEIRQGRLMRPFAAEVTLGSYWLTRLKSREETTAMSAFRDWLLAQPDMVPA
jgi:LysR family transcriptional regulator of beta-lactamase